MPKAYADIRRSSLVKWCQIAVRSSKMQLKFSLLILSLCLPYEVPHWLNVSKFTRLRAVFWRQHGSCFLCGRYIFRNFGIARGFSATARLSCVTCGQWRIQLWADRAAPIDQNLALVMAARLRHGAKFSPKSLTFGHFLYKNVQ